MFGIYIIVVGIFIVALISVSHLKDIRDDIMLIRRDKCGLPPLEKR